MTTLAEIKPDFTKHSRIVPKYYQAVSILIFAQPWMAAYHPLPTPVLHKLRYLHQRRALDQIALFRCRFLMHIKRMIYGYARVSTAAQDETGQVR
jgi:hypothetical protein